MSIFFLCVSFPLVWWLLWGGGAIVLVIFAGFFGRGDHCIAVSHPQLKPGGTLRRYLKQVPAVSSSKFDLKFWLILTIFFEFITSSPVL